MKTRTGILILALSVLSFTYIKTNAQARLVNLNVQPMWGPAGHPYATYYYIPAVESYYSINERKFIYLEGGRWIARPQLAKKYKGYDLFSGYKVVMNTSRPYLNFTNDRIRYSYFKNCKNKQANLRDKHSGLMVNTEKVYAKPVKYKAGKKHPHKFKSKKADFIAEN